ncbi:MAG TPA: hypothetical protein VNS09_15405 [Solirubrobacter sp.]|nr:hypothetical protein [Solirubrobacter sp.]
MPDPVETGMASTSAIGGSLKRARHNAASAWQPSASREARINNVLRNCI